MEDSVKSDSRLEVSVSFGRFENDALSWEKWSSFSQNKYLEEVGNLSTPGSVAQKKAYFEAHYKKIAARKAEELDQEKLDPVIPSADASSKEEEYVENSYEVDDKFGLSSGERLIEEVAQEDCRPILSNVAIVDEAKDDNAISLEGDEQRACTNGLMDVISSEEEKEDAVVAVKCGSSASGEAKDELNVNLDDSDLNIGKDSVLVELGTPQKDSQDFMEKPPERKKERKIGSGQTIVLKKENPKLNARSIAQKVTPTKTEKFLAGSKKKVVSPAAKTLPAATPRIPKPASISTPISASQSLKKKVNGSHSQLPKSKNLLVGESKRVAPTSLHMSLSLGPTNSLSALSMTRKSLIMDKMGDKDIVKRAFKTFQSRTSESTTDERPSTMKHVSSTAFKQKISTSNTPTKGNEGMRKDSEKRATQRSQSGARTNPLYSGPQKGSALDRKNTKVAPTIGLRNDEKAEKRKEFLKKLEAKSIAREADKAQLAKSKVGIQNGTRQQPALSR